MGITRKLDDKLSNFIESLFEQVGDSKIGGAVIFVIAWLCAGVYLTVLYSEFVISLLMYRHRIGVKVDDWRSSQFSDEEREWLNKTLGRGYWKSMIQGFSADDWWLVKRKDNEIRFLRKKDALAYKMVWG